MRTRNPSLSHSEGVVRGHIGRRASASGVRWTDSAGNDFGPAPDVTVIGGALSETPDGVLLSFSGSGQGFTNGNGATVNIGEVVVIQADGTIADTTTAQDTRPVGVVQLSTADTESAPVLFAGYVGQVNTTGTVLNGDYLETSTTAGKAQSSGTTPRAGSFGRALADGPDMPALLFGSTYITGGGGGGGVPGWFNVRDYGAVGNGSTDDTAAFNAAIAALVAYGVGVLYIPASAAAYKITGALTTLSVPCTVMGDGWATGASGPTSRISFTSTTAILFAVSANGCEFRDLAMFQTGGTATAGAAISTSGGILADFDHLLFDGWFINIDIDNSQMWAARRCYFGTTRKYGIKIRNTSTPDAGDWTITDCDFSSAVAADAAIRIESSGGGKILNCKINGGTGTANFAQGIDLAIGTGVDTSILLVSNCSIESVSGNGIRGTTSAATSKYGNIEIGNCQFTVLGNTGKAISLVGTTAGDFYNVIVHGCEFGTAGTARSAIQLTNCNNVILTALALYVNFTSYFTNTTSTNVRDYTGGVAAGVTITGTPSANQIPVASSGTAASWTTVATGTTATDANIWRPLMSGGAVITDWSGQAVMAWGPA